MSGQSPYLWEPRDDPAAALTLQYDVDSQAAVLTVRGSWDSPAPESGTGQRTATAPR